MALLLILGACTLWSSRQAKRDAEHSAASVGEMASEIAVLKGGLSALRAQMLEQQIGLQMASAAAVGELLHEMAGLKDDLSALQTLTREQQVHRSKSTSQCCGLAQPLCAVQ